MARKQQAVLCSSCDEPLRHESAFCPNCGRPTVWATHDERVQFEVRQWRASRAREGDSGSSGLMMLVRTDDGYAPAPARPEHFVWDQPLHPDHVEPRGHNPHAAPKEAPVVAPSVTDGNGNGHSNGNGHGLHAPVATPTRAPETDGPAEEISRLDDVQLAPAGLVPAEAAPLSPDSHSPETEPATGAPVVVAFSREVKISKKAVALGIALAVGLPLGGRMINLAKRAPASRPTVGTAAAPVRPVPVAVQRYGFGASSADAVRYAVVVANPNRSVAARDVAVSISLFDRAGKLVGTDIENIAVIPAGSKVAVTGQTAVAGPAVRMQTGVASRSFEGAAPSFAVRDVRFSTKGNRIVVKASVSGRAASPGARVVAVYFDRTGRVLGGDFTFADVPKAPRSAAAAISTTGVKGVSRVEVFVAASR